MSVASANAIFADLPVYAADTKDDGLSPYLLERRRFYTDANWATLVRQLSLTSTLYVGNLSFFTTEEQLLELFGRVGPVARLIMGLNKATKTPCGFCFVEYETHEDALACQRFLAGSSVDERVIRADLDPGFEEGRQFGRSRHSGGQRRDDFRQEFDAGRGGWAPPPQKDIFPLFAEHPVGTTTVAVRGGVPTGINANNTPLGQRKRPASRSRSRSRERQRVHSPNAMGAEGRTRSRSRSRDRDRQ